MSYIGLRTQVAQYVLHDGWSPPQVAGFLERHLDELDGDERRAVENEILIYRTAGDDWRAVWDAIGPRRRGKRKATMPDPFAADSEAPQQGVDF